VINVELTTVKLDAAITGSDGNFVGDESRKFTLDVPVKSVPRMFTGLPVEQLIDPVVSDVTVGGVAPNAHVLMVMVVPQFVCPRGNGAPSGLHVEDP
jgi:hypothetical protein